MLKVRQTRHMPSRLSWSRVGNIRVWLVGGRVACEGVLVLPFHIYLGQNAPCTPVVIINAWNGIVSLVYGVPYIFCLRKGVLMVMRFTMDQSCTTVDTIIFVSF